MRGWRFLTCALLAWLVPLVTPAQEIALDFRSADLRRVVETLAAQTGQRFIYDESLRGNVTIAVPRRVSPEVAIHVLEAALLMAGFVALPGPAGVRKIVKVDAVAGAAPWLAGPPREGSEAAVTTLITLESAPVSEVVPALRELLGRSGVLVDYPPTNSILVAASEAQVRRLLQLARALDQASDRELRVLPLRYRDTSEIEPLLEEALAAREDSSAQPIRITSDARTGSLIVEGQREDIERVRALLRALDLPRPGKHDLHVVRVLNTDAEALAENLRALVEGGDFAGAADPVQIAVDPPTHSLVIRADPTSFAALARVIGEIDVLPARLSVEVSVLDVSTRGDVTLGFDALLPIGPLPEDADDFVENGAAVVAIGNPGNVGASSFDETFFARVTNSDPLLVPITIGGVTQVVPIALGGVVRAERSEARFHTLMQPHLLMTSGEEHRIQSGDNIPVPVSSPAVGEGTDGVSAVPSGFTTDVTFERQDTGVDLRMTPTVLSDEVVAIGIELSVSELASTSEDLGPTLTQRDLSATVRLRDGQIGLIGALRAPQRTHAVTGVPFLSRIPVLGQLFTTQREIVSQAALVITAQPTLLGSAADEEARAIRLRLAFERQLARTSSLAALSDAPYALLVDTRDERSAADAVAEGVLDPRWQVRIVRWTRDEKPYWDVYATGFPTLGDAGAAAIELRDAGWRPQLTAVPKTRR